MNFLPMQYYLEVVKEKSISHAAARLHITQQTLSAHIAALEKELGCTLFRRKPDFALTYIRRYFRERSGRAFRRRRPDTRTLPAAADPVRLP